MTRLNAIRTMITAAVAASLGWLRPEERSVV